VHTIAAGCAFKVMEIAEALGLKPDVLAGIDIPPRSVDAIETRIPFDRQLELWEAILRSLRAPGFPIFVASALRPSDYNVIGFAAMTQGNLREAFHQAIRYQRVWTNANAWELEEKNGTATLRFVTPEGHRLGVRCNTECGVAEIVNAGRVLSGTTAVPLEIRFNHAAPDDLSAHEAFFKAPLRFGARDNAIVIDAKLLDTPLLKTDPELAKFFQRHGDAWLANRSKDESVTQRLEAVLVQTMRLGAPTIEDAARRLGMSTRTLRRRLTEEGSRFQDVLERSRCDLAKRYLAEPKLAVGEVAFLLGFSEPSAFHRAFKRWTGKTPLEHRRSA
jgi:AraC-like DNA-binding protein